MVTSKGTYTCTTIYYGRRLDRVAKGQDEGRKKWNMLFTLNKIGLDIPHQCQEQQAAAKEKKKFDNTHTHT
jgi:hypothetical protein